MGVASPAPSASAGCIPNSISLMRATIAERATSLRHRSLMQSPHGWLSCGKFQEKAQWSAHPMSRPSFTDEEALAFHMGDKPGKLEVVPTKPMATQRDLSLAYSPGVAVPVLRIAENPDLAYEYTAKGNMVAVISNGTAILGLGDLGALASKPVMEGKSVLFKRFADVNSIDLEIDTKDVD